MLLVSETYRRCNIHLYFARLAGLFGVLYLAASQALAGPSALCDEAANRASDQFGIPFEILKTITRVETGRAGKTGMIPWPWTVNMEGKGLWFDSESLAKEFAYKHFKNGARSFDIGCFQINYKWHGQAFSSIDQMFDPDSNARYAAQFLISLKRQTGSWTKAIGAYHSKTHAAAEKYLARYNQVSQMTDQEPVPHDQRDGGNLLGMSRGTLTGTARASAPLGQAGSNGSLFPLINQVSSPSILWAKEG